MLNGAIQQPICQSVQPKPLQFARNLLADTATSLHIIKNMHCVQTHTGSSSPTETNRAQPNPIVGDKSCCIHTYLQPPDGSQCEGVQKNTAETQIQRNRRTVKMCTARCKNKNKYTKQKHRLGVTEAQTSG